MIELFIATNASGQPVRTAYWDGFQAACEGQRLEDMPTPEHVQGWWFALKCEGDTNDYADWQEDISWMRGGC